MKRRSLVGLWLSVSLIGPACLEPAQSCDPGQDTCVDAGLIQKCIDGRFETIPCAQVCPMEDPLNPISLGCMTTAQGPDECSCARYCTDGSVGLCASSNSEWLCQDTQRVERFCFEACAANPASPLPAGCEYDIELQEEHCLCTAEGQPCEEPKWDQCLGTELIVSCQRGAWTVFTCEEQCSPAPSLGCTFDRDRNEAVCICHESPKR